VERVRLRLSGSPKPSRICGEGSFGRACLPRSLSPVGSTLRGARWLLILSQTLFRPLLSWGGRDRASRRGTDGAEGAGATGILVAQALGTSMSRPPHKHYTEAAVVSLATQDRALKVIAGGRQNG
jgi:hypothetical protein